MVILKCAHEKVKISLAKNISSLCFLIVYLTLNFQIQNYAIIDKFRLTSLSEYLSMRT